MRHSEIFGAVIEDAVANGATVRFRAEGTSMYPTIRDGEIVSVAAVLADEIVCGDVLLCRHGARVLAHRVVGMRWSEGERIFELRGDAKASSDAPVRATAIVARVVDVRRDRRIIRLSGPVARMRRAARVAASGARTFIMNRR